MLGSNILRLNPRTSNNVISTVFARVELTVSPVALSILVQNLHWVAATGAAAIATRSCSSRLFRSVSRSWLSVPELLKLVLPRVRPILAYAISGWQR